MPFIVRMGANAIAILLITYLLPQVMSADGALAALAAAFVLGLGHAIIRPIFVPLPFPGVIREVTGSCILVEAAGKRFLVDCGMFQGGSESDRKNARPFPVPP